MTCRYCLQKTAADLPATAQAHYALPLIVKEKSQLWQQVLTKKRRTHLESRREYFRWIALESNRREVFRLLQDPAFLKQIRNPNAFAEASLLFGKATIKQTEKLLLHPAAVVRNAALAALFRGLPPEQFLELALVYYPQTPSKIGLNHWRHLIRKALEQIPASDSKEQSTLFDRTFTLFKEHLGIETAFRELEHLPALDLIRKINLTIAEWQFLFNYFAQKDNYALLDFLRYCPLSELPRYLELTRQCYDWDIRYGYGHKLSAQTVYWRRLTELSHLQSEEIVTALEEGRYGGDVSFVNHLSPHQTKEVLQKFLQKAQKDHDLSNLLFLLNDKNINWPLLPADAEDFIGEVEKKLVTRNLYHSLPALENFAINYWAKQNNSTQVVKSLEKTILNSQIYGHCLPPQNIPSTSATQKTIQEQYQNWQKQTAITNQPIDKVQQKNFLGYFWTLGKQTNHFVFLEQLLKEHPDYFSESHAVAAHYQDSPEYKEFYLQKLTKTPRPAKEQTSWRSFFLRQCGYLNFKSCYSPAQCQEVRNFVLAECKPQLISNSWARRIILNTGVSPEVTEQAKKIIFNYAREGTGLQDLAFQYLINLSCHLQQPLIDEEHEMDSAEGAN